MPLYIRALHAVPSLQIMAHRIVWAAVLLVAFVVATKRLGFIQQLKQRPSIGWTFVATSVALSVNWFVYIWSVGQGRVVDASLGYFMNPLFNVVLAVLVLKERLRLLQWLAVGVAALGVLWLALLAGHLPWIGLIIAVSWGSYGLLRKTTAIDALGGLTLETVLLLPLALGYLVYLSFTPQGMFAGGGPSLQSLLLAAGPLTAIPLLAFSAGARRIPLSLLGILQYVSPSLQLAVGVFVFHEPLPSAKLLGFGLIWLAVALYSLEGLVLRPRATAPS